MNIQVNTGNSVEGSEDLNNYVKSNLSDAFERYKGAITRIEVHLTDENADKKGGNDKRCLLEARIANHQPVVVSSHADTIHQAIETASTKLLRSLDTMVGKMSDRTTSAKDLLPEERVTSDEVEMDE